MLTLVEGDMLPIVLGCSLGNTAALFSINLFSYLRKLREKEAFENSTFKDNVGSLIDNGDSQLNARKSYYSFESLTPNLVALISTIGFFTPVIAVASAYSMEMRYELATIPALAAFFIGSCYLTYKGVNGQDIFPNCINSGREQSNVIYDPNSVLDRTDIEASVYR